MKAKQYPLSPQSTALFGFGTLLLGVIVLAHSETEEGAFAGAVLTLGGLVTLTQPEVVSTLIETFNPIAK